MVFNLGSQGVPLWTWLVPLGSAVLLFIASMITLAFTIRSTNRRAKADRDDARERDYHAWRRDTLLRLGADAMAAAVEAVGLYTNFRQRARPVKLGGSGTDFVRAIDNAAERVMVCSTTFSLIGAKEAAAECMHLRHAIVPRWARMLRMEWMAAPKPTGGMAVDERPGVDSSNAICSGLLVTRHIRFRRIPIDVDYKIS